MRIKKLIVLQFLVFLLFPAIACSLGFDKLSLIGVSAHYNLRKGTLDFGDSRREDLGKPSLLSGGFVLGKRWRLSDLLQLQISTNINYGSVVDDTLPPMPLSDGSFIETAILTKFLYGGCVVDFQYPLTFAPGGAWFLHGGGGAHAVDMAESEITLETPPRYVQNDPYLVGQIALSASVQGGLGFEKPISPGFGLCFNYSLRYWYPVHYGMSRDLFPVNPVHYHEQFLSHEMDILLAAYRTKDTAKEPQTYWIMPSVGITIPSDSFLTMGPVLGSNLMVAINKNLYLGARLAYDNWFPVFNALGSGSWNTHGWVSGLGLAPFFQPSIPLMAKYPSRLFGHAGCGYYWFHADARGTTSGGASTSMRSNRFYTGLALGGGIAIGLSKKRQFCILPLYHRMISNNSQASYISVDLAINIRIY